MLSLLMAGTMCVCISGGDVWAENTVKLTSDTVYNVIGEIPTSIEMNGHNIISNVMFGDGTENRELLGTGKETLTIVGDNTYQYGIGAFHGENSKINFSNIKEINISGAWITNINGSALYTNAKGSINLDHIGLLKIENSEDSGIGIHTMAGEVHLQADSVIIAGKNDVLYDRAILAQLSGATDESNDKNAVVDINANTIDFHTAGIAIAAVNWSEPISGNEVKVNLKAKDISIISDNSTGLSAYSYNFHENNDNMTGKTAIILNADETVVIKGARNAVYATNGRKEKDAFISIDAEKTISITGNTNSLYAGSNALVKINDKGTAKVSLTGNVVAENGGQIVVKNADQIGALKVDGGIYNGNNISIKYSAPTLDDRTAVCVANNGSAVFDGDKTEIIINSQSENDSRGVWVTSGGKVEFNAKETVIDVTGVGGSLKWGFGLLLNGTVGGSAVFNGQNVAFKNYQDHYTSQTVTAKAGSEITFNNTGNVLISAKSPFGVTAVDNQGNITFNNSGNVDIVGTIVPGDKSAQTNVVGIQSGSSGAETVVTDKVKDFNITLSGAGVDNDGTSYSTGTYGIILDKDVKALINSATLNIKMNVADNVEDISPGYHTTEEAYGIDPDGGYITVGTGTVTNITVQEGLGTAYAVNVASDTSVVELLGDTTIVAAGKTASYALNAEDGGQITIGSIGKTVHLTGDIKASGSESNITLNGNVKIVKGSVNADGGTITLNGSSDSVYDSVGKFTTANSGKISVSGGMLNIDGIGSPKFNLVAHSLVLENKGVLQAASATVFGENDTNTIIVKTDVDKKVLFNGGKLAVSDATYTLEQSKAYSTALKNMDQGTTTLTMTGVLNDNITNAGVEVLGNTGAVHTNISATCDNNELVVGGTSEMIGSTTVNNDFGVKDLKLGDSNSETRVAVGGGNVLTLVGDGGSLITDKDGNEKTGKVEVNIAGGSLVLGSAAANSGGNLKAEVKVSDADSKLQVDAGTFNVEKITASQGEVNIGTGAALKSDKLNVGAVDTTAVANINGAAEIKELTASAGSTINVGNADSAGELKAQNVQLNGAQLFLDPVWQGNSTIGSASKAGLKFTGEIDGGLTVGQNSVLSLGTADTAAAENAFGRTGLSWGELAITAALYIDSAQELGSSGSIIVDGSLTHENNLVQSQTNKAYFAAGSLLMVKASAAEGAAGALKTSDGTLDVANGAKLYIDSAEAGKTYTVASGFKVDNLVGWKNDNLLLNKLVKGEFKEENGTITITTIRSQSAVAMAGVLLPNILDALTSDRESDFAGIKYLSNAISDLSSDEQALAAVNGFAQGAENSGASHSGTMAAFTIGDSIQSRMSLASDVAAPQGGKGKDTDAGDNGSIWAQYIHNKDKVDNLGGASYDGQYNGVIIGSDFAPTGKYHSGVAFSYGDGSSSGSVSKNEFDFWGLSYYGSIKNDDTNVIFDAGYSRTSNSVKGAVAIESDTKVLTLGVKGEKLINNGHGTSYVPYAGLRYLNVDGGSYNGTIDGKVAAHYSADTANIWMLPLGIGVRNETITASGWKVRPMADIAYVWILGDKNSTMDVTVPGVNAADRLGYDIMDSGFFVGKLGIEAEKDDWTYGLGYAYQKGSSEQNSKWFIDLKYSF